MKKSRNSRWAKWLVSAIFWYGVHELIWGSVGVDGGVKNSGMSFGWLNDAWWLVLVAFIVFFIYFRREKRVGFWLVLMGGAANLVDRFRFGYVRDYWLLSRLGLYNNINDWLITIGAVMFIYSLWKSRLK